MAIKRDHIDQNRVPDAPVDWGRYSRMLREYGRVEPSFGLDERLESEWDARLTEHRRLQSRRRIVAPLATLAVTGIGFLILSESALRNGVNEIPVASEPVIEEVLKEERQNFAAPEVPPIWSDTNLPMVDPAALPGMDTPSGFGRAGDSNMDHEPPVTGE